MVRRIVALLGLLILIGIAAPAAAQDLPEYTPDQRWARAEYMANAWVVMGIHYAKLKGDSVDQFSQAVFESFDPGWPTDYGPQEIMRAINRNWSTYREARVEILESSADKVRFRTNRPYKVFFGDNGDVEGVTMGEYEHMLDLFHQKICEKRGMTYEQRVEGDWVHITVTTR